MYVCMYVCICIFFFFFGFQQSDMVNEAVIQTTSQIARALTRLSEFKLRQRPLLITHLVNTSKFEGIPYQVLASVLQALRDLWYPFKN